MVWVGNYLYCCYGLSYSSIIVMVSRTLVRGGVTAVTVSFEKTRLTRMMLQRQKKERNRNRLVGKCCPPDGH